jgi:cold shock CspA family protein
MRQLGFVKYYDRAKAIGVAILADGREAILSGRRLSEPQRRMIIEEVEMEFEVVEGRRGSRGPT